MNAKRLLLPALVLPLAVVGGILWWTGTHGGSDAVRDDGALSGPLGLDAAETALTGGHSSATEVRGTALELDAGLDALGDHSLRLEVRLAAPLNTPADDTLAVIAFRPEALEGNAALEGLPGWMAAMSRRATAADYAAAVSAKGVFYNQGAFEDGVARLAFPAGTTDVRLVLDGRYLYLDEPFAVRLDGERTAVVLEPRVGAWITGALVLPAAAASRGVDALTGKLTLQGSSMSGPRRGRPAMARSRADVTGETFEFRGLASELSWTLTPELDELYGAPRMGLELEPGEHRELVLELVLGARLAGRVVDPAGEGIGGVELSVGGDWAMWGGAPPQTATSAPDGAWSLSGVPPGQHTVRATCEGWRGGASDALELEDGARVDDVLIVLEAGASLAGVVRWPDNSPAAGATLDVIAVQGGGQRGPFGGARQTRVGGGTSDEKGRFRISGLGDGPFTLRATRAERGAPAARSSGAPLWRDVLQALPPDAQGLELKLAGPLAFSGRVVDDLGQPVTSFDVIVEPAGGGLTGEGAIQESDSNEDEDGRFTFARVGPGEWSVSVAAAGHVGSEPTPLTLPRGDGPELAFTLQRVGELRGVVTDGTGAPLPGAWVEVGTGAGGGPFGGGNWSSRGVETDAEGHFALLDLEPGGVELVAEAEGWANSPALAVEVPAGGVIDGLVLSVRVGGRIVGTVLDEAGDPLSGRNVSYGSNAMGFGAEAYTASDAVGGFVFERVTPGKWNVTAAPSMAEMGERMGGSTDESAWMQMMGELLTESVVVEDGAEVHVHLGGDPRIPVKVVGQLLRAGAPVEGATISAVSEGSAIFAGLKSSRTGPEGRFELTVDRPARYVISSRGAGGAFAELAVDVPEVEEFRVDLVVPEGRIVGVVRLPDGTPAENVRLDIQPETAVSFRFDGNQATTKSDGSYAFEALPEGSFSVRAATAGWRGPGGGADDEPWGVQIRTGVDVAENATTGGVDFTLTRAGAIAGRVKGPDGAPVSGVSLFVRDATGNIVSPVSRAVSDATGRFRHGGLAPGAYTVSARGERVASSDAEAVVVREGEDSEVEVRVEPATTLLVSIKDPEGELLRARLEVLDEDGREVSQVLTLAMLQSFFNEGFSTTEQKVGPVPPGKYRVIATTRDGTRIEKKVTVRGKEEQSVRLRVKD